MAADDEYFLPLEDQRVFGAGIRKKRIAFVPASLTDGSAAASDSSPSSGAHVASQYLSIVLPQREDIGKEREREREQTNSQVETVSRCHVCNLPLLAAAADCQPAETSGADEDAGRLSGAGAASEETSLQRTSRHEASIAHQVCLAHSRPPSHLDRTRHGVRYLSSYGWDPDSRQGVGAPGREGIPEPLKARVKHDTVGLGMHMGELAAARPPAKAKVQKLNARQVRRSYEEMKRRGDRLRDMFCMDDDVLNYLHGRGS